MSTVIVELGERSYPISIAENTLTDTTLFDEAIQGKSVVVVTNDIVKPLYLETLLNTLRNYDVTSICIPDGEQHKNLQQFESITTQLLAAHTARDTTIIALGGGVVGDLTGFVAACFQRGIPFIQVPTTLLSQVDSSVGGKTAVNHPLGKNMIGAFYQPQAVVIDINTLASLPPREFSAGMAEVIKYGIIYDGEFFAWLEKHTNELRAFSVEHLEYIVTKCCQIKADIVAQDEKEHGIRALLNLGHTFGHAIEAEQGYGNWLHGEAVACGMVLAAEVAVQKAWLTTQDLHRIVSLIEAFDLPINAPADMNFSTFMGHMQHDKKVLEGAIRFIIPTSIGSSIVTKDIDLPILQHVLN